MSRWIRKISVRFDSHPKRLKYYFFILFYEKSYLFVLFFAKSV
ncbi:hypothetical protein HMPREF0645_0980 [Hallella bergensis DSM 17361]|uniref:Uncharacterized protein n=1 Tax=Hallella bergensis DSM 17361 TaxID=585502 RepID=D1PVJ5_9BACT|nr:hypothetical protein HMPREF0645_0980 [Hallella bergensis DSM 17361]